MIRRALIAAPLFAALVAAHALAGSDAVVLRVIVNPANTQDTMSESELRNIVLGRRKTWADGTPIRSYLRPFRGEAGFAFLRQVMRMTPERFKYHWQEMQLSGQGAMPKTIDDLGSLIEHVSRERGAVSVVTEAEAKAAEGRVRVVSITE